MSETDVVLSPAQKAFIRNHIPGFDSSWRVVIAAGAGSERRFLRISSPDATQSRILVVWNSQDKDWDRFIGIQREMAGSLPESISPFLPAIHAVNDKCGLILEEDFGASTLSRFCKDCAGDPAAIETVYRRVLDTLILWQEKGKQKSPSLCHRVMDKEMFLWETEYFAAHCVTEYYGLDHLLNDEWENERQRLAETTAAYPTVAIHRDFQSENVMIANNAIRFVDFQGARLGPAGYDLASLFLDPYVAVLDEPLTAHLLDYYNTRSPVAVTDAQYRYCAMQRLMQALGAYGNLSLHKGKEWYHAFLPTALKRLDGVIGEAGDFPQMKKIVSACVGVVGE